MRQLLSRSNRTRVVSLVAAGLLGAGGAVLFASAPVAADQTPPVPGPDTVIFKGSCGLLGIAASSKPSVNNNDNAQSITVPAGTPLTFVNQLGTPANLELSNQPKPISVASGSYAKLAPQSGPFSAKMTPASCGLPLGSQSPLTVSVTPAPAQSNSSAAGQPGQPGAGQVKPPANQPAAGARPVLPNLPVHQPAARGAVPPAAEQPGAGSGTSGGRASGVSLPSNQQPVADSRPASDSGPASTSSLLALIAAVCLVGVGAAAVRTIVAQRNGGRAAA